MNAPISTTGLVLPPAEPPPERGFAAWWQQMTVLTGRQLKVAARDLPTLIQILVFPALTMLMFKVVLGDIVGSATGQDSAFGTVPLVVLVSAMTGSVVAGSRLNLERRTGLLSRLWVLPVNRLADFSSRVVAELVRILVTSILILAAGYAIGFRFNQGVGPAIGLLAVALAYGAAFAMITLACAVNARPGAPVVQYIGLASSFLMFFNSGFSPVEAYPGWLQPFVANQPMTPAIDAMRGLAAGGPVAGDVTKVVIWTLVLIAVTFYPALRGYRKAASGR
ncbi:ABC transporter permease [Gordonia sp. (in: high G+C Gram-positive bacteria)]|uniref:ABC transporter permease n=1 Tax=Gordonia sp. (in: high G+C Gram-positive bacteria) TaxID=84139 RepID=UPI0035277045